MVSNRELWEQMFNFSNSFSNGFAPNEIFEAENNVSNL